MYLRACVCVGARLRECVREYYNYVRTCLFLCYSLQLNICEFDCTITLIFFFTELISISIFKYVYDYSLIPMYGFVRETKEYLSSVFSI